MPAKHTNPAIDRIEHRTFALESRKSDSGTTVVPASLSSEEPVLRWWGYEILDHSPGAVDLSRADRGLPILANHDPAQPIGRALNVRLSGTRLRGNIKFGRNAKAQEVSQDVADGVLDGVSVGYEILEAQEEGTLDGEPVYRVTRWKPFEASIVAIPADNTVGVNRSLWEHFTMPELDENLEQRMSRSERRRQRREAEDEDRNSASEIMRCARQYDAVEIGADIVERGGTIGDLHAALKARLMNMNPQSVPTSAEYGGNDRMYAGMHMDRPQVLERFPGDNARMRSESAYRAGMWALGTIFGNENARSWIRTYMGARALGEDVNTKGGTLVPEELSSTIIRLVNQYGTARQFCDIVPMGSDTTLIPRRTGGITAAFIGENTSLPEDTDDKWDNVRLTARKLGALVRMSTELSEDGVIDVATWLAEEFGLAFHQMEDDCLFNGDGGSTYGSITGVIPKFEAMIAGAGAKGAYTATGHGTFATITTDDLSGLQALLPKYARPGARWYCSSEAKSLVFDRLGAAAGGMTSVELGGVNMQRYGGYLIEENPKLPSSTGSLTGSVMMAFGNLRQAASMGTRRDIRMRTLLERYADADQIGVIGIERFDINVHDIGTDTVAGPLVVLIGG